MLEKAIAIVVIVVVVLLVGTNLSWFFDPPWRQALGVGLGVIALLAALKLR